MDQTFPQAGFGNDFGDFGTDTNFNGEGNNYGNYDYQQPQGTFQPVSGDFGSSDINYYDGGNNQQWGNPVANTAAGGFGNMGNMGNMASSSSWNQGEDFNKPTVNTSASDPDEWANEPPLLEELGINFGDILRKTVAVQLPFKPLDPKAEQDTDLAGPLVFVLALGFCLLMTGKVHFGYIYGFCIVGCLLIYFILNLMSDTGISIDRTTSILGYSIPPIVVLSLINVFLNLQGVFGFILAASCIFWCTLTATRFIEVALQMQGQRYLIAYPVTLLYTCFALLTIF